MNIIPLSTVFGLCALGAISSAAASPVSELVAIKAGQIHTMDQAGVIQDGVMLLKGGKIVAVGRDLEIPAGAQVIDYGPSAELTPGFVAADSGLARGWADPRTADAGLFAADGFDPYANHASILSSGVTSAYIDPASGRLLGGVGAVIKLAGDPDARLVDDRVSLDGSISSDAYRTPGFWEPPVPATADVGMGVEEPQLPHSLQGAIMALGQLAAAARGEEVEGFGPYLSGDLAAALKAGATWRFKANTRQELRAIAAVAKKEGLKLVVDGAWSGDEAAEELAAADVGVIFEPRRSPGTITNWGKGKDAEWPSSNVPAALAAEGVRVAVAPPVNGRLNDLYQVAMLNSGGLDREAALAMITSNAAELIGAGDRIGSLAPGKDADFVVMSGAPMTAGSSVRATWVGGELVYLAKSTGSAGAVVLEVDELFVGDGEVLRPGQVLMQDGQIVEVGEVVAHPRGATVVRGAAAMPGIIDALGHLGLQGSRKAPAPGFSMMRLMTPGDETAKHVAEAGVTTVMLAPYSLSGSGTALMAYKPAASDFDKLLVEDDAAIRIQWSSSNRYSIGSNVRSTIEKAVKYRQSWLDYEKAMSEWTPPAPEVTDKKSDEDAEEQATEDEGSKDSDKKKKKKKELEPDSLTGVWTASSDWGKARFQFQDVPSDGMTEIRGSLRSDALSPELMRFEGTYDHKEGELSAHGIGIYTELAIAAKIDDEKLSGTITWSGTEHEFEATRTSKEYVIVKRPELRKPEAAPKAPKGMPKAPRVDAAMEPWRRALAGEVAVIVTANRDDEILDAVEAFAAVGIKPVLMGASDAWRVKDQLRGRVAGILPERWPLRSTKGIETVNRFAELQQAGIPVAFYSDAEEGAGDLFMLASFAVAEGMSPMGALRALTADAATMMGIADRVGRIEPGLDADVLLLDQSPLEVGAQIQRTWVAGEEVVR